MRFRIRTRVENIPHPNDRVQDVTIEGKPDVDNIVDFIQRYGEHISYVFPQRVGSVVTVEVERLAEDILPDFVGRRFKKRNECKEFVIVPKIPVVEPGVQSIAEAYFLGVYVGSGAVIGLGDEAETECQIKEYISV